MSFPRQAKIALGVLLFGNLLIAATAEQPPPNMDRLAAKGVNFTNAHCPAPGGSPSRNAILFGAQPFNSGLSSFYNVKEIEPGGLDALASSPYADNTIVVRKTDGSSQPPPQPFTPDAFVTWTARQVEPSDAGQGSFWSKRRMLSCDFLFITSLPPVRLVH